MARGHASSPSAPFERQSSCSSAWGHWVGENKRALVPDPSPGDVSCSRAHREPFPVPMVSVPSTVLRAAHVDGPSGCKAQGCGSGCKVLVVELCAWRQDRALCGEGLVTKALLTGGHTPGLQQLRNLLTPLSLPSRSDLYFNACLPFLPVTVSLWTLSRGNNSPAASWVLHSEQPDAAEGK